MPLAEHNTQVSITIPKVILEEIRQHREETGIPMAAVVRVALRDYLAKQKAQKPEEVEA